MKANPYAKDREKIVGDAIWPIASELRMMDVADLIAMLRFERYGDLSDVVSSAAEMFFLPGTIKLGIGGDYTLDWSGDARVVLDLEIRPGGVTIYARLSLESERAGVEIDHIVFDTPSDDPAANTQLLENALRTAAYRPIRAALAMPGQSAAA
jgi:hypothetical protein